MPAVGRTEPAPKLCLMRGDRSVNLVVVTAGADRVGEQIDFYECDALLENVWLESLRDPTNTAPSAVDFRNRMLSIRRMLDRLQPRGRILDVAAGTGRLSVLLAEHATELTLLDASPVRLAIAQQHLDGLGCTTSAVHTDVFSWTPPPAAFDTICFGAWLHHVPASLFDRFWNLIDIALAPSGLVIFEFAASLDADIAPDQPSDEYAYYHDPAHELSVRDLNGRRWRVVHRVWDEQELVSRLSALGWSIRIEMVDPIGYHWASARRPFMPA